MKSGSGLKKKVGRGAYREGTGASLKEQLMAKAGTSQAKK